MSASLVGSEMCIRDRSGWAGRLPTQVGEDCAQLAAPRGIGARGPTPNACLLYTSDAADDM
eukprot:12252408-Alexandrium_andersonii.AAC.1